MQTMHVFLLTAGLELASGNRLERTAQRRLPARRRRRFVGGRATVPPFARMRCRDLPLPGLDPITGRNMTGPRTSNMARLLANSRALKATTKRNRRPRPPRPRTGKTLYNAGGSGRAGGLAAGRRTARRPFTAGGGGARPSRVYGHIPQTLDHTVTAKSGRRPNSAAAELGSPSRTPAAGAPPPPASPASPSSPPFAAAAVGGIHLHIPAPPVPSPYSAPFSPLPYPPAPGLAPALALTPPPAATRAAGATGAAAPRELALAFGGDEGFASETLVGLVGDGLDAAAMQDGAALLDALEKAEEQQKAQRKAQKLSTRMAKKAALRQRANANANATLASRGRQQKPSNKGKKTRRQRRRKAGGALEQKAGAPAPAAPAPGIADHHPAGLARATELLAEVAFLRGELRAAREGARDAAHALAAERTAHAATQAALAAERGAHAATRAAALAEAERCAGTARGTGTGTQQHELHAPLAEKGEKAAAKKKAVLATAVGKNGGRG